MTAVVSSISNGRRGFEISNWKPYSKNTLQGFFTLTMPSGMVLHGCTLHRKNESRWIGMPAQKFTKADGTTSYTPVVEFASDDAHKRFQEQVVASVMHYLAAGEKR